MTTQQPETTPSCEAFASQLQVFASAWAIVGGLFDAGDGMQTADAKRAIVLDMWRRLHAETEQLRAGYDAARQEIASLKAQPYDQQAMGLCHVCGWKGVIDYPDGPVCVACEHDKQLAPQPTPQPLHVAATSCPHEIDKDKIVLHFDSKQPGKNALAQLAARLQAAQAQEDARLPLTDDEAFKAYTAATGQKLLKQGPDRQRFLQAFRLAENAHGITDQQGETA